MGYGPHFEYNSRMFSRLLQTTRCSFFDTGVKRALGRTLDVPLNAGTYEYGKALEHFVIIQIVHLSR